MASIWVGWTLRCPVIRRLIRQAIAAYTAVCGPKTSRARKDEQSFSAFFLLHRPLNVGLIAQQTIQEVEAGGIAFLAVKGLNGLI